MARPVDREVIGIETVAHHVPGRSTHTTQGHTGKAEGVSRKQRPSLRCVFPGKKRGKQLSRLRTGNEARQEAGRGPWNHPSTTGFVLTRLFNDSQMHLFLFSMVVLVYILAMAGNATMVLLIWADAQLHKPMYFLLSQLSFLDIFFSSVTVPKMIVAFLFDWTSISSGGCGAQMFFFMFLGAAECLLLALMAYDRYVAICNPLRYPVLMSRRVCLLMVVSSWLGGSLNASIQTSLTLQFPYCGSRKVTHFFCEVPSLLMLACADTEAYKQVLFVTGVVVLLVPIAFITTSYAFILVAVLQMRSVEGRQKALATCSSHLTVVNLFYGPLVYTYMLPASYHSPGQDDVVSVFYTVLTPFLNPVIYSLRNKEVTGAMKKVIGECGVFRNA
ncbi:olfactory receptor 2Z1-like [Macaca thibetana thibetana]|uniref:olfactory receptor 2Z1-like n=1 Tax=Macaca thibetana thibetana TaxID=257877 RepID=UPI0021BC44CE|nr:olfactory receptor 2Z1-like [Macaca thibetana thibetana]